MGMDGLHVRVARVIGITNEEPGRLINILPIVSRGRKLLR